MSLIEEMVPSTQAPKQDGRDVYCAIEYFLIANAKWALPANMSSFCLVHKQLCPLKVGWVIEKRCVGASGKDIASELTPSFSTPTSSGAWCAKEVFYFNCVHDVDAVNARLSFTDFTQLGGQSREG